MARTSSLLRLNPETGYEGDCVTQQKRVQISVDTAQPKAVAKQVLNRLAIGARAFQRGASKEALETAPDAGQWGTFHPMCKRSGNGGEEEGGVGLGRAVSDRVMSPTNGSAGQRARSKGSRQAPTDGN